MVVALVQSTLQIIQEKKNQASSQSSTVIKKCQGEVGGEGRGEEGKWLSEKGTESFFFSRHVESFSLCQLIMKVDCSTYYLVDG